MANKKISDLPAAGAVTGAELVEIAQSGASVRSTVAAIKADKEDSVNKSADPFLTVTPNSGIYFPTQSAVKNYVDAKIDPDVTLAGNDVDRTASQNAIKTYADTKQTALGFTAENVANKDVDGTLAANSDTKYASQKATKTYADTKSAASTTVTIAGTANQILSSAGAQDLSSNRTWTLSLSPNVPLLNTAQVFSALNTFTDLKLSSGKIYPSADSTTALRITKADGATVIGTWDTTNGTFITNNTPTYSPSHIIGENNSGALAGIQEFHSTPAVAGGTATPTDFVITPKSFATSGWAGMSIVGSTDKAWPYLEFLGGRGTLSVPTSINSGDLIGEIAGIAVDTAGHYRVSSLIDMRAIATGLNGVPGQIEFTIASSTGAFDQANPDVTFKSALSGIPMLLRGSLAAATIYGNVQNTHTTGAAGYRATNNASNWIEVGFGGATNANQLIAASAYVLSSGRLNLMALGANPICFAINGVANSNEVGRFGSDGSLLVGTTTNAGAGVVKATGGFISQTSNGNAVAGALGEYVSSLVALGAAQSLTTATALNVTSISLTAGDWDVRGNVNYSEAGVTVTETVGGITSTSVTIPTDGSEVYSGAGVGVIGLSAKDSVTLPSKRLSLSATTTVYLVAKCTFSVGTVSAYGSITARRVQ